jgi:hypothetical protein
MPSVKTPHSARSPPKRFLTGESVSLGEQADGYRCQYFFN